MEVLMAHYMIALMYRETKPNCAAIAEWFEGISHDRFSRRLAEVRCWPTLRWRKWATRLIGKGGYLLVDDMVLDQWGQQMFGVSWVDSSQRGQVVWGINVVLLIRTDGQPYAPG